MLLPAVQAVYRTDTGKNTIVPRRIGGLPVSSSPSGAYSSVPRRIGGLPDADGFICTVPAGQAAKSLQECSPWRLHLYAYAIPCFAVHDETHPGEAADCRSRPWVAPVAGSRQEEAAGSRSRPSAVPVAVRHPLGAALAAACSCPDCLAVVHGACHHPASMPMPGQIPAARLPSGCLSEASCPYSFPRFPLNVVFLDPNYTCCKLEND